MARRFNGTSDYLSRASALVGSPIGNFTIAAWIRPEDILVQGIVIGLGNSTVDVPGLAVIGVYGDISPGMVRFTANWQGAGHYATADSAVGISANVWSHIAAISSTTTPYSSVFVNGGNRVDNPTTTAGTGLEPNRTAIGCLLRTSPQTFFKGDIAHVAFWNAKLSDQEVAALAAGVSPLLIRPGALAEYYPLDGLNRREQIGAVQALEMTENAGTTSADSPPVYGSISSSPQIWIPQADFQPGDSGNLSRRRLVAMKRRGMSIRRGA